MNRLWEHLQKEIERVTGVPFSIVNKKQASGGDINQTFYLISDKTKYVVKINSVDYPTMFEQESNGLNILSKSEAFVVPKVITLGLFEQYRYLILEFIEMSQQGSIQKFATALATLHCRSHSKFGLEENNYIGTTPQNNSSSKDWGEFFCEHRLAFQLNLLAPKSSNVRIFDRSEQLLNVLPAFLNRHRPKPALVHGDLWQGNYTYTETGKPVIYDPACYYADHEVDLAMLELFGNPGSEFFEGYKEIKTIKSGYSIRKKIYNLYHILNHANMFGGSYIQQSEQLIDDILGADLS